MTESGYEHTATVNFDFNAQGVLMDISRYRERTRSKKRGCFRGLE